MRRKAVKKVFTIFLISIILIFNKFDVTYSQESFVIYDDESSKIVTLVGDDLFLNFKEVYPGEVRTQEIKIHNKNKETIGLYLRAESADKDKFESKKEQVISEELIDLLTIKLTLKLENDEEKLIYSGRLSGDTEGKEKNFGTMINPILLGEFKKNSKARILAEIYVPESLGNKYQNVTSKIKWIFSCDVKENLYSNKNYNVVTNDSMNIIIPFIFCMLSVIAIILLFIRKIKK